jgi:hypothetical protein
VKPAEVTRMSICWCEERMEDIAVETDEEEDTSA